MLRHASVVYLGLLNARQSATRISTDVSAKCSVSIMLSRQNSNATGVRGCTSDMTARNKRANVTAWRHVRCTLMQSYNLQLRRDFDPTVRLPRDFRTAIFSLRLWCEHVAMTTSRMPSPDKSALCGAYSWFDFDSTDVRLLMKGH